MNPQSPCLNCPDRHPYCHGKCDKYISYRAKLDEINAIKLKEHENDPEALIIELLLRRKKRIRKG